MLAILTGPFCPFGLVILTSIKSHSTRLFFFFLRGELDKPRPSHTYSFLSPSSLSSCLSPRISYSLPYIVLQISGGHRWFRLVNFSVCFSSLGVAGKGGRLVGGLRYGTYGGWFWLARGFFRCFVSVRYRPQKDCTFLSVLVCVRWPNTKMGKRKRSWAGKEKTTHLPFILFFLSLLFLFLSRPGSEGFASLHPKEQRTDCLRFGVGLAKEGVGVRSCTPGNMGGGGSGFGRIAGMLCRVGVFFYVCLLFTLPIFSPLCVFTDSIMPVPSSTAVDGGRGGNTGEEITEHGATWGRRRLGKNQQPGRQLATSKLTHTHTHTHTH